MTVTEPARSSSLVRDLYDDVTEAPVVLKLPSRVMAAIERREDIAEVLIKLIQLAVVLVFAVLYALAPKPGSWTDFTLVPYALTAYFLLTLLGLAWALRSRLPDWAVYLSIVFDMGLLMTLLWSFHIQYEQPASFILKSPTLLYVFIFIALRTLRFQPRFVIAAGLAAAVGWLTLVFYVVTIDPDDTMITSSYVTYLTDNAVLLGAEFDKIIAILTVTFVLALVLKRGRSLLVQAVAESAAARDFSRFFDEGVASQIRGADSEIAAGEGLKREAAILNVDMRGFTTLAEKMPPADVMSLLADYQARFVPAIQDNGGTIDKFLGDGIMATFGAVEENETFAADALRATDAIIEIADAWSRDRTAEGLAPIAVNASVASGPLVFGAVGGPNRLEYTVIGSPVNASAKLEKHNKELDARAVTTGETYDLALVQGYVHAAERPRVRTAIAGLGEDRDVVVLSR